MDVFRNPDEVIEQVEQNEERYVEEKQVKRELDESPEGEGEDEDEDEDEDD
jgi:hypothetical protein